MKPTKPHASQRGHFAYYLYEAMEQNPNIFVISADLGYAMMDHIREDFPDRFICTGASEQAAMGIAVGLAMGGKIPFIYSITPFLLWRAAETIRLYVDHESIPVKLVGGGRDKDYAHDGFSHDATDAHDLLELFPNIVEYWPESHDGIQRIVNEMVINGKPSFVSLKR